jgi:hypothetical protein
LDLNHREVVRQGAMKEAEIARDIFRHDARNLQLKRRLTERGADCESARQVECRFRAPNQAQAGLLAQELDRRGFLVLAVAPSRWKEWRVAAEIMQSISRTASHDFTEEMVRSAAALSCLYEGWGTSLRSIE